MVNRKIRDHFRRRKADIDCNAAAPIGFTLQTTPTQHATASRAKPDFKGGVCQTGTDVTGGRSGYSDALAFVVIRPERAVSAAQRAITSGDGAGIAFEGPAGSAAMARTLELRCHVGFPCHHHQGETRGISAGEGRKTGRRRRSARADRPRFAYLSTHMATPMPPPTHSVARPFLASRFCISCSRVTRTRAPEAPMG